MDTVSTQISSVGGSENPISIENIAYNARCEMEVEVTSANPVTSVELGDNNNTNPIHTGYEDFSSLRSRPSLNLQNSVLGFENPISTLAIHTYENIAQDVMEDAANVACDAKQANTPVYRNISFSEYDDLASLRSRLAAQMRSSNAGPITTHESINQDGMKDHTGSYLHTIDDTNQMNTLEDESTITPAGYDDFASLRSRLIVQIGSSVGSLGDSITMAEAGEDVTPAAKNSMID